MYTLQYCYLHRYTLPRHQYHKNITSLSCALCCQRHVIYMCAKRSLGSKYLAHMQTKRLRHSARSAAKTIIANQNNLGAFQYPHLQALAYAETPPLEDNVLNQLRKCHCLIYYYMLCKNHEIRNTKNYWFFLYSTSWSNIHGITTCWENGEWK